MDNNRVAKDLHIVARSYGASAGSLVRPRRCRQCGAEVSRTDKRCPTCGQPLSIGEART
jgi:predicted Zn-ribbon and HTH transcriptional regulator